MWLSIHHLYLLCEIQVKSYWKNSHIDVKCHQLYSSKWDFHHRWPRSCLLSCRKYGNCNWHLLLWMSNATQVEESTYTHFLLGEFLLWRFQCAIQLNQLQHHLDLNAKLNKFKTIGNIYLNKFYIQYRAKLWLFHHNCMVLSQICIGTLKHL